MTTIFAKDFLVSANAHKIKTRKSKLVKVKKDDVIETLMLAIEAPKEELMLELEEAEKMYHKLEGKFTKKKIKFLSKKIEELKEKLESSEEIKGDGHDIIEHDGMTISPPVMGDLESSLEDIDQAFNVPEKEEPKMDEQVALSDLTPPDFDQKPSALNFHLLNIPPPPPKNQGLL